MIETPESSNLKSFDYDINTRILTVVFKGNAKYEYAGVPIEVHAKMVEAYMRKESVGRFLNKEIKGKYEYKKV